MDDEDFLAAVEADNTDTPIEDQPPEPAKVEVEVKVEEPEQPAPVENVTEPVTPTEPPVVQPEHKQPEPGFVPIAAMLDARDKAKAAEARAAQLEQALQSQQQQAQRPDEYEDPEGARAYDQAVIDQRLYQTNLQWSERIASIQHGAETVTEAKQWGFAKCDQDPHFNAKVAASPDPIGFVVEEFKRDQIASQVTPDDFKAFQAWKAAQSQLQQQTTAQAVQPNTASPLPPRSLASAPSAGDINAQVIQSDAEIFDEVIGKR